MAGPLSLSRATTGSNANQDYSYAFVTHWH